MLMWFMQSRSRTHALSKIELFKTVVKGPFNSYSTKSAILDVAFVYRTCSVNSIDGSTIVYSIILPFGIIHNSCIGVPFSK